MTSTPSGISFIKTIMVYSCQLPFLEKDCTLLWYCFLWLCLKISSHWSERYLLAYVMSKEVVSIWDITRDRWSEKMPVVLIPATGDVGENDPKQWRILHPENEHNAGEGFLWETERHHRTQEHCMCLLQRSYLSMFCFNKTFFSQSLVNRLTHAGDAWMFY